MADEQAAESSAVRVALWRALHVEVDPLLHVLDDEIGLRVAAPDDDWRRRPDMDPEGTRWFRAGIVARARFVEDLVAEQAARGVAQYIILGAGLDTFAQRKPEVASHIRVFEVDQPGPQAWKRRRLIELDFGVPEWLRLVPVDFEAGDSWWDELAVAGFDPDRPAVVASTGVSMYLTKEANGTSIREIAGGLAATVSGPASRRRRRGPGRPERPSSASAIRTKRSSWRAAQDSGSRSTCPRLG